MTIFAHQLDQNLICKKRVAVRTYKSPIHGYLQNSHLSSSPRPHPRPRSIQRRSPDCDAACGARCELSSRPRLCKRACGTCCARCDCVPAGTSGNYDACPCYANMTTHGGKHKCP
ncbi:hypothetical protein LWI29_027854 [Acer saccharum]|uniref:Uncharacterized protein n=1 Tax=Acer saccharum TaxID=4024 RepID=A0AA39VED1_ACESA|nr:hypothetical protein LWI29_027854 [Acer saccharum]